MKPHLPTLAAAAVVLLLQVSPVAAQDTLDAARQLYASASYDDALSMLDRLKSQLAGDRVRVNTVEQYRAFCLLAVGRRPEAERAVESIVASEPGFRPEESASPRVLSVFRDVRQRVLPGAVRQRYEAAKASFDQKAYDAAITQFDAVLALLELPEIVAADPSLADLRTVTRGFKDLARAANVPPPPPPPPVAATPEPPKPAASTPAVPPPAPTMFGAADKDVTPPVVVRQQPPAWPKTLPMPSGQRAILDMVVDARGLVESIAVRPSLGAVYDGLVATASQQWLYKPALKDGAPVKYRRLFQIVVGQ
jgi:hypothetical protein